MTQEWYFFFRKTMIFYMFLQICFDGPNALWYTYSSNLYFRSLGKNVAFDLVKYNETIMLDSYRISSWTSKYTFK